MTIRASMTVEVRFDLSEEDRFICSSHPWDSYRGQKPYQIEVTTIKVDLVEVAVKAEGKAIQKNGGRSGWAYSANLSEEDQIEWARQAIAFYGENENEILGKEQS